MGFTIAGSASASTVNSGQVFTIDYTITRASGSYTLYNTRFLIAAPGFEVLAIDEVSGVVPDSGTVSTLRPIIGLNVFAGEITYPNGPASGTPWVIRVTARPMPGTAGYKNFAAGVIINYVGGSQPAYTILTFNVRQGTGTDSPTAPTAPSSLTATAASTSQINLAWTNNASNAQYVSIVRSTSASGTYTEIAKAAATATSYQNVGLASATTYYYKVAAVNNYGVSAYTAVANATTSAAPAAPTAPTGVSATTLSATEIQLAWTDAASTETEYRVYRHTTTGGPYTLIDTLPAGSTGYIDTGLTAATAYFYKVASANGGGESLSSEVTATTNRLSTTVVQDIGLYHTPTANIDMAEVDGRVIIVSDLDRAIVEENNKAFWAGLKPHREAPDVEVLSTGALTGVYQAWSVLVRKEVGDTRSVPSPASTATVELTNQRLRVIPLGNRLLTVTGATNATPIVITTSASHGLSTGAQVYIESVGGNTAANGLWTITNTGATTFSLQTSVGNGAYTSGGTASTAVACRDTGVDASGSSIAAANFVEIYVAEQNMDRPVRVATVPLGTLSWTSPADLSILDLQDGTRRPMEIRGESTIPPAVGQIEYFNNRTHWFADRTIRPSLAEQGTASLTMTAGSRLVSCANYSFTDALYHKPLYINRKDTGWAVTDVISATQLEISHADPSKNEGGWEGTTVTYYDFSFPSVPRRVWRSPYFLGEAENGQTFSPETVSPLDGTIEGLQFGERNPSGAITSKEVLMLFADDKAMHLRGGLGLDGSGLDAYPEATVIGDDGLLSPNSLAKDSFGNVWGVNSQGIFRANQAGIQKMGRMANDAFMFQLWFDIGKARGSVGEFLNRDDQYVVGGLTRVGASTDGLDGMILDTRTGHAAPYTTSKPQTFLLATPTDSGATQLVYGNAVGEYGVFMQTGIFTDDIDFTQADPYANEVEYTCYVQSGTLAPHRSMTIKRFWPHVDQSPLTTAVTCTVAIDTKKRNDNSRASFSADVSKSFTTSTSLSCYTIAPKRGQRMRVRFSFPSKRSERVEWSGLQLEGIEHGADA